MEYRFDRNPSNAFFCCVCSCFCPFQKSPAREPERTRLEFGTGTSEFEPRSAKIVVDKSKLDDASYTGSVTDSVEKLNADAGNAGSRMKDPNGGFTTKPSTFRSISSNKEGHLDGDIHSVSTNVSDEVSEMTNPTYMSAMTKHTIKDKERAGTPASESESSLDQSESGTPLIPAVRVLDELHESIEEKTLNSNENSVSHSQGGKSRNSGKGNHENHRNIDGNIEDIFDSSWNPIQEESMGLA